MIRNMRMKNTKQMNAMERWIIWILDVEWLSKKLTKNDSILLTGCRCSANSCRISRKYLGRIFWKIEKRWIKFLHGCSAGCLLVTTQENSQGIWFLQDSVGFLFHSSRITISFTQDGSNTPTGFFLHSYRTPTRLLYDFYRISVLFLQIPGRVVTGFR